MMGGSVTGRLISGSNGQRRRLLDLIASDGQGSHRLKVLTGEMGRTKPWLCHRYLLQAHWRPTPECRRDPPRLFESNTTPEKQIG